jgi:hypothetical protein
MLVYANFVQNIAKSGSAGNVTGSNVGLSAEIAALN